MPLPPAEALSRILALAEPARIPLLLPTPGAPVDLTADVLAQGQVTRWWAADGTE